MHILVMWFNVVDLCCVWIALSDVYRSRASKRLKVWWADIDTCVDSEGGGGQDGKHILQMIVLLMSIFISNSCFLV